MEKLIKIQSELKAPKSQRNSFGNYNYRNAEDILEALKPLLLENGCTLTLTDSIEFIGNRYYVKATATIFDGKDFKQVSSYAREEESKKGMDGSQITGASSSYARKYALNGLFLIDDTKDSDATNNHNKEDNSGDNTNTPPKQKLMINTTNFTKAKQYLKDGGNIAAIAQKYDIPDNVLIELTKKDEENI